MKAVEGQMSLFEFIESPTPEIWDSDIRDIIERLDVIAENHNMGAAYEWQVWEHVPYLGFRLSFEFRGSREQFTNALLDDVQNVCDSAKEHNVELSIMSPPFFDDASPQYMDVYSMFKDKERQKVKKGDAVKKVLREYVIPKIKDKPICKHSNHECNKEELWKVADTLDETQCPHMCCRKCEVKGCGARCNGSSEPKTYDEAFLRRHISDMSEFEVDRLRGLSREQFISKRSRIGILDIGDLTTGQRIIVADNQEHRPELPHATWDDYIAMFKAVWERIKHEIN